MNGVKLSDSTFSENLFEGAYLAGTQFEV